MRRQRNLRQEADRIARSVRRFAAIVLPMLAANNTFERPGSAGN
jgi:hypothetical protein